MAYSGRSAPPFPGWAWIAGVPVMLKENAGPDGKPNGTPAWQQTRMKFAPGTPTPEAQPYTVEPDFEIPAGIFNWDAGVGYRWQGAEADKDVNGAWYWRFMDKSGDYIHPALKINTVTPSTTDTTNGGNQAVDFTVAGADTLVIAMGRYLLYRVSDTAFSVAKDFGAGAKITGLAVYRGIESSDFLFIALGGQQNYWVWDGTSTTTTFTQASVSAYDFRTYHNELWMLNTGSSNIPDTGGAGWQIQKCVDGGTSPTWGGAFILTDSSNTCKHLVIHDDRLYIRSQQGILAAAASENDSENVTGDMFRDQTSTLNECRPVSFLQFLLTQLGNSWISLDTSSGSDASTLNEMGPATLTDTTAPTVGEVTAAAPYSGLTVFYATWNAATNTAYLCRWGEWKFYQTLFHPLPERVLVPAHYQAMWEQPAKITGMHVSQIGAPNSGQWRLYFFDAAGNVNWMDLPRGSYNCLADSGVTFQTANTSEVYLPSITMHHPTIDDVWLGVDLGGRNFSSGNPVTFSYRLDQTSSYGGTNNLENSGQFTTSPGQRNDFVSSQVAPLLDGKLSITNNSTTTPPAINAWTVYSAPRPVFKMVFQMTARASDRLTFRNGIVNKKYLAADWLTFFETQMGAGVITIVTPDGRSFDVIGRDYQAVPVDAPAIGLSPDWEVTMTFLQHRSETAAGSENSLAPYTEAALAAYPSENALLLL